MSRQIIKKDNGKYAIWSVTSDDAEELRSQASMETKHYNVLLSTFDVVAVDRGPKGIVMEPVETHLADLPTDYFQITISTP